MTFYCESTEELSTWDAEWNLYNSNDENDLIATVKYGYTREQYEAETNQ